MIPFISLPSAISVSNVSTIANPHSNIVISIWNIIILAGFNEKFGDYDIAEIKSMTLYKCCQPLVAMKFWRFF